MTAAGNGKTIQWGSNVCIILSRDRQVMLMEAMHSRCLEQQWGASEAADTYLHAIRKHSNHKRNIEVQQSQDDKSGEANDFRCNLT
jgi:hypothetical protein